MGLVKNFRVGKTEVGKMRVGKMGQIMGETGTGKMGVILFVIVGYDRVGTSRFPCICTI